MPAGMDARIAVGYASLPVGVISDVTPSTLPPRASMNTESQASQLVSGKVAVPLMSAGSAATPGHRSGRLVPSASVEGLRLLLRRATPGAEPMKELPAANAARLRLHTICPYYTMFPLAFPFDILADAKPTDLVLDPFCGRGTTTFAARLRGLTTVGVDSNQVAAAVAASKLVNTSAAEVVKLCSEALGEPGDPEEPEGRFWDLCFDPQTFRAICKVRQRLLVSCSSDAEVALRAVMLGILHGPRGVNVSTYLSNQMPRTYATKPAAAVRYWEKKGLLTPPPLDVNALVKRRAEFTLADLPPKTSGAVYMGDARRVHELLPKTQRAQWIITSPPYLGLRTYRPDQWLRNWFVGGNPDVDYSKDGQLDHHPDKFAEELGSVWRSVAAVAAPQARLVVRFGSLPSVPVDLRATMEASLKSSGANWRVEKVVEAGSAANGKRQAGQFGQETGDAANEIDLTAVLDA